MLGSIEQHYVYDLLDALASADGSVLIQRVQELAQQAPDFSAVLAEIITCLHYLALLKQVPDAYDYNMGDKERYLKLLESLSAEDIQLYYQIALNGRRDLPLAPDQRNGLEMVLLRMLAFRPDDGASKKITKPVTNKLSEKKEIAETVETKPGDNIDIDAAKSIVASKNIAVEKKSPNLSLTGLSETNWHEVVAGLGTVGILNQLVEHSAFIRIEGSQIYLAVAPSHSAMVTPERQLQLQDKLSSYFSETLKLNIEEIKTQTETPAARSGREQQERQTEAEDSIVNDDNVKNIMDAFNAHVDIDSVQAIDSVPTES